MEPKTRIENNFSKTDFLLYFRGKAEERPVELIDFNGTDGRIARGPFDVPAGNEDSSLQCELKTADSGRLIWTGYARLVDEDSEFLRVILQIRSQEGNYLDWCGMPAAFSIADGGYEALNADQVGRLLDDLLQFQEVTHTHFFPHTGNGTKAPMPCKALMEDIGSTDAILLEFRSPFDTAWAASNLPSVVAIELFEVTYILIGFVEAIEGPSVIFTLTSHVYRDKRHAGRRFLSPPVITPEGEIVEVSDFGARIRKRDGAEGESGEKIEVQLPGIGPVAFKVVHRRRVSEDEFELGCMIGQGSSMNWIRFLLQQQYPLLKFRTSENYAEFWRLLADTGYTTKESELNLMIQSRVETEWNIVDSSCPANGATVVAMDGDKMVGTIGVTRVGTAAWNTQLLASSKDPAHIPQTRSLFSWRTRYILQQSQGEFNIGFFSRDKAFLDRFFRKFYIHEKDGAAGDLTWEEWRLFTHVLPNADEQKNVEVQHSGVDGAGPSVLFDVLRAGGPHDVTPTVFRDHNCFFLKGRPFQHLCQYFSSAWLDDNANSDLLQSIRSHLGDQQVLTVRSRSDLELAGLSPSGRTLDDGWDVVWICHRRLLLKFLSNSLRALELMNRKYGMRSVA